MLHSDDGLRADTFHLHNVSDPSVAMTGLNLWISDRSVDAYHVPDTHD